MVHAKRLVSFVSLIAGCDKSKGALGLFADGLCLFSSSGRLARRGKKAQARNRIVLDGACVGKSDLV